MGGGRWWWFNLRGYCCLNWPPTYQVKRFPGFRPCVVLLYYVGPPGWLATRMSAGCNIEKWPHLNGRRLVSGSASSPGHANCGPLAHCRRSFWWWLPKLRSEQGSGVEWGGGRWWMVGHYRKQRNKKQPPTQFQEGSWPGFVQGCWSSLLNTPTTRLRTSLCELEHQQYLKLCLVTWQNYPHNMHCSLFVTSFFIATQKATPIIIMGKWIVDCGKGWEGDVKSSHSLAGS